MTVISTDNPASGMASVIACHVFSGFVQYYTGMTLAVCHTNHNIETPL